MPARFGVALGALSVYDWWFEFGLRRPDHVGSLVDVGYAAVLGRVAVLTWMTGWAIGQLHTVSTAPASALVDGMPAPAAS